MVKKKIIAIVQVRMGSTRLPKKAMKIINNKYVFELVHKRLKKSKLIDQIIFSTSKKKENDILVSELKKKIDFFRGKENDVLDRYFHTAKKFRGSTIVRITCDCPFVDSRLVDKFVQTQKKVNLIMFQIAYHIPFQTVWTLRYLLLNYLKLLLIKHLQNKKLMVESF